MRTLFYSKILVLITSIILFNTCRKDCINKEPVPPYLIYKTTGDVFNYVATPHQDSADEVGYLTTSYCTWSQFNPAIFEGDTIYPFRIRLDSNYVLDRTISDPFWNFTTITFSEYCDSLSRLSTTEMKAFIKKRIIYQSLITELYYVPSSYLDKYGYEDTLPYQIHRMIDAAKAINILIENRTLDENFCSAKIDQ